VQQALEERDELGRPDPGPQRSGRPGRVEQVVEGGGRSVLLDAPYRFRALGVVRVRDGLIVSYDDYMDPVAMARLLGRTAELAAAL
jgi:uncharacterized protein